MAPDKDFSHRTVMQKLGLAPDQRVELKGDLGPQLRRDAKTTLGRGFARSGPLDGAIVLVESVEQASEVLRRYRPRLRDSGYLWLVTRKRGHYAYVNQMALVPEAKRHGLIDNKTCSIDGGRSAIRFVVPRALRKATASRSAA